MDSAPFPFHAELCDSFNPPTTKNVRARSATASKARKAHGPTFLPGDPRLLLDDGHLGKHLLAEFQTDRLNKLAPYLFLVAKQDSTHISSLTHQVVRGRRIIITEDPGLHLVWVDDRVFVKPLPRYLLSWAFWKQYVLSSTSPIPENERKKLIPVALGFLRSYSYLIQHRSDYRLATRDEHRLLPARISYPAFIRFTRSLNISDESVCPRYHFGELRLSRLNRWAPVFLGMFTYHKVEGQYGSHFARFYGPLLFIFAVYSVLLSAMQVVLGVQSFTPSDASWAAFARVARGFAIFTLTTSAAFSAGLLVVLVTMAGHETIFALKDLCRRARGQGFQQTKATSRTWSSESSEPA
ncbi:hypothetical protein N7492_004355 [Penicillium capsulatum]|uniref:Uncharacterized protein n=1 Tax=Penicillium capsulatum TaxID=69766 RepID=A0A9W9LQ50_9EURO|nr:hypothetical protein N7492_004355 [Penicillium capsulatum]KAJ6136525.1 hypothetical protein N7512_001685 [Penicillium capsulatum]